VSANRVHLLATELGVKSKAIIDKCRAEGLENITNHMSPVTAGLAATIREWFSGGEHGTAVESAEKVDLEKVRVKRKRKTKDAASQEAVETEVAVETAAVVEETKQPVAETTVIEAPPVEEIPVESTPVVEEKMPPQEVVPEVEQPKQVEPPKPPEPVMPAGPMLEKPKPAKLTGPRIVRVEAPEPERSTRPKLRPPIARPPVARPAVGKPPVRGRFDQPITEPLMPKAGEGVKGKKGGKDRTHGRRHETEEEAAARKTKLLKWRERDMEERRLRLEAAGGESGRMRPSRKIESKHHAEAVHLVPEKVVVYEPITVKNLAAGMGVKIAEVMSKLMQQGVMATANQAINAEAAELLALEFGRELEITKRQSLEEQIAAKFRDRPHEHLVKRPPVVTVLGHVDHGKTSLLDRIRNASVAKGEAGGITQHIGAYQVTWGEKKVTFLDTPGHEAFTAMRARGANMTDVVVLVVAADDGVMPQTIEAIHHAKAAGVPIIVALNKIDLPGVDINRIYGQFAEHDLSPAEWGGKTEVVKTSAVTGQGVNELLEYLDYTSELLELKGDNEIPATGWVVEAKMTTNQGPVATVLIKEGKLSKGDIVLAGAGYGRIRSIKDSYGRSIKTATSSMPVEISGLSDVPQAGDRFYCVEDINKAKEAAEESKVLSREEALVRRSQVTLDNLFSQIAAGNVKELNLIIRADVQGSVDVLVKYLSELSTAEVKIKILHSAVGGITEGDVVLAEASNAIIIGFNVVADVKVAQIAEAKGVDIRFYNIIYRITEDLKKAMVGLLEPERQEKVIGRANVRNTFKVSNVGTVAGCYVISGVVAKSGKVRLTRNNIVVKDDLKIDSLKHFKDDVREVKTGFECGIKLANYDDVKVDDVFEVYDVIEVARTL
jgi:translation initiation factor IF-2